MTKIQNSKQYDLEERTYQLARKIRDYVKKLYRTLSNLEYGKQLIKSSCSQAWN